MAEGKKKSTASAKKNTAKKADTKKAASTAKGAGLRFRRRRIRLISFGLSYCLLSEY